MELYIIRHAQSTNNALGTDVGRSKDPALTDIGFQQAEALAAHLANGHCPDCDPEQAGGYQFDHLYCSAMYRALLTAKPVAAALGMQPELWIETHEHGGIYLDGGSGQVIGYSGMTRAEILDQFPDYILPDILGDKGWWNRGYETQGEAIGRAVMVAESLIQRARQSDERIALITHGAFASLLIKALFSQLPAPFLYYHHYNTAITRIDIRTDGLLILRYLNRIAHLPPELVTH